jgi:CcmD family protein
MNHLLLLHQSPPPGDSGFQKVQGDPAAIQPQIPAPPLVGAAYGFIWLCVLVFLLSLWRRGRRTAREIDELERKLGERTGARGAR